MSDVSGGGKRLQGLHLHLDLPSGIAGDMTMGALFDLGVPVDVVREGLARLGGAAEVGEYELVVEKVTKGGMAGTDVKVRIPGGKHDHDHDHGRGHVHVHGDVHGHDHDHDHGHDHGHHHRHYADIRKLLDRVEGRAGEIARDVFARIARAESKLHGISIDEVAFHEVGAIDSIVDVVGSAVAVAWLAPVSVSCTPVPMGHGTVKTAHGLLPVPSPAAMEILREAGVPTVDGGVAKELCTPTGAAIVASLASRFGAAPAMTVRAIGYGAGDRDLADRPNLARAVVGEPSEGAGERGLVELAANLDDMNPELCEHVTERLFAAGALDVWWQPVTMKKTRPAFLLGVLAPADRREALMDVVLTETTTLGVRWHAVERRAVAREQVTVETPHGPVVVKIGRLGDRIVNVSPEYESCREVARRTGVPLKAVYAAAIRARS